MSKNSKQAAKLLNFGEVYGAPLLSKLSTVMHAFGLSEEAAKVVMNEMHAPVSLGYKVEAKAKKAELVQYGPPGEGSFIGVRTPYSAGFVHTLKMEIPQSERKWDGDNKEWVVAGKHLGSLMIMVKDHYGIEPTVTTAPAKNDQSVPKASNIEIVLHVGDDWIEVQTPYDANFLTDFKEFFTSKKWQASVKRWKVPYSKENLNMASYLIKRHYGKTPKIVPDFS